MTDGPLLLARTEAANLLGISPSTFSAWVAVGILPGPVAGTKRWSRVQLERAASGLPWVPPDAPEKSADDAFDAWEEWDRNWEARKRARHS